MKRVLSTILLLTFLSGCGYQSGLKRPDQIAHDEAKAERKAAVEDVK